MQLTGTWVDFFIAFASGVVVSFTPCVYPVMPLTASYIACANISGSRRMAFIISLVYVLGMALVYVALALVAALTGKIFGQFQNSAAFYLITAFMLIIFALIMVDLIKVPTLSFKTGVSTVKPGNLWAVLIFGMASGLIVGPCTAPVLGTLLVYISSKQNLFLGGMLMFFFAYGLGFSLILVGTFSGLLGRLPKSGKWLISVKYFSGIILFSIGLFFLYKAIKAIH